MIFHVQKGSLSQKGMCFVDGVAPQDSDANQTAQDTAHHNFIFIFEISNVIDPSHQKASCRPFCEKGTIKGLESQECFGTFLD